MNSTVAHEDTQKKTFSLYVSATFVHEMAGKKIRKNGHMKVCISIQKLFPISPFEVFE